MPTLDPRRDGLTQSGFGIAATCSRQPGLADLGELDLRQAREGEQPLADQLVEGHGGARTLGPA